MHTRYKLTDTDASLCTDTKISFDRQDKAGEKGRYGEKHRH